MILSQLPESLAELLRAPSLKESNFPGGAFVTSGGVELSYILNSLLGDKPKTLLK
jgi:hypothetical protein